MTKNVRYPAPIPPDSMNIIPLPGGCPEDVILDASGRILCGLEDGSIVRCDPDGSYAKVLLNTGGRPLGLDWLPDGRLLVCDCERGLLAADLSSSELEVLVDAAHGARLRVCNNPSVARDGTVYFTDSSARRPLAEIHAELIEHVPTGRLLRRDVDGSVHVLLDGLHFANGVVLADDESFVLVAETGAARINRLWLTGTKRGRCEAFADNLPGMPDNMSRGEDGLYWVALPSAMDARLEAVHRLPFLIRRMVARLPEWLRPPPSRRTLLMAFDREGTCVHFIEGDSTRYHLVTGVRQRGPHVYAVSIEESAVAVLALR